MKKNEGIIQELLSFAKDEDLKEFILKEASNHRDFSVRLSQWLMSRYSKHANQVSFYVEEVRQLFGLKEEKYYGYNRSRYYDDIGLNWDAIDEGMIQIVNTLQEKLADGIVDVVVEPVVEFYKQLASYHDEFLMEDDATLDDAGKACDTLLLKWAQHPNVPKQEKQIVYEKLQELSTAPIMDYVDGLSDAFFMNYLTYTLSDEEALQRIEQLTAMGNISDELVHKHIDLLRQRKREREAQEVIRRNLNISSVLDAELDRLYDKGEDYAALNLIDLAMRNKNYIINLLERKIRFLLRLKDTNQLIEVYRQILLGRWNAFEYYYKLKEIVPTDEWPAQYALIVEEATARKLGTDFLARFYSEEQSQESLYRVMMSTSYDFLGYLSKYLPKLPQNYHLDLFKKGIKYIEREASQATKRSDYARIASQIREMSALPGAKPLTDELVCNLRATYRRRPAFLDELNSLEE